MNIKKAADKRKLEIEESVRCIEAQMASNEEKTIHVVWKYQDTYDKFFSRLH